VVLDHSGFDALWTFGGCMLFASAMFLGAARWSRVGFGVRRKA
jgi:hypothetical protein